MSPRQILHKALKEKELSYADVERLSGVAQSLVGRYDRGEVKIGPDNAPKLAKALGLDPADLIFGRVAA